MLAYLAGSIEFADRHGKSWRLELRPFLEQRLGHQVYDPAEDEKKNLTDEEMTYFRLWKTSDFYRFREAVRKIIDWDLAIIENKADYVICYWDRSTNQGGGTPSEVTVAYRKRKPVYIVTDLPHQEISGWVLSCADRIFSNFDDLRSFLLRTYRKQEVRAN